MTNYVKSTNFATKDNLASGDPLKIVKGTEINTEFDNIAVAVATKAELASPTFTGTVTIPTVAISAGTITGITDLAVADGGTGASTATDARTNLSAAKSGANSDITSITGLTTALPPSQGGTGATTLTANNVVLGNGTSAVQFVAPGTSGNVLVSNGSTWASGTAGVTSVATGNGLSGGTITSTGTILLGDVAFNSIGSYCQCRLPLNNGTVVTSGSTYVAGTANNQVTSVIQFGTGGTNNLTGTWRWMGAPFTATCCSVVFSMMVRVA
jgi:hypothetical protein